MYAEKDIQDFAELVFNLANSWQRYVRVVLLKNEICFTQYRILDFLDKEKEMNMTTLKKVLRVSAPAVTHLVDDLLHKKYISRTLCSNDRRQIKIMLTEQGVDLVCVVHMYRSFFYNSVLKDIESQESEDFFVIVKKISDKI